MAAVFGNLHDVTQVLAEYIAESTGIADAQPGPPRDAAAGSEPSARITLLYVTPVPGHRSDPSERGPSGLLVAPTLTLSCQLLVTTSGSEGDDPIAALGALGRIMTLFHDTPTLRLPLSAVPQSPPGVFTDLGRGSMSVVQVPMTLDQTDKVWSPWDVAPSPWVLFDVGPVQLASTRPPVDPAPPVRPGGVGLDVRAGVRPRIARVVPDPVRPGGRVRIETDPPVAIEHVVLGGVAAAVGSPVLHVDDGVALLDLSGGGLEVLGPGPHPLTVRLDGIASRTSPLRVAEPGTPSVDAPAAPHDPAAPLVLTGANLDDAAGAVLWPDGGVTSPTDVHNVALTAVGTSSVTVPAGELAFLDDRARDTWRVAVRVAGDHTPHVVLEVAR